MLKIYCSDCGAVNQYSSAKPNFCQKCGIKFGDVLAQIQGTNVKIDEKEKVYVPTNMKELEVEIDIGNNNTMTLGTLIGTVDTSVPQPESLDYPSRPGAPAGTNIMEEFKREAGSLKRKPDK